MFSGLFLLIFRAGSAVIPDAGYFCPMATLTQAAVDGRIAARRIQRRASRLRTQ
jgi:hypothetical protein